MLPLLSKYLVEEKREEEDSRASTALRISSLFDISSIVFSSSPSSITSLTINLKCDNHFLCFLPLLFSLSMNLKELYLSGQKHSEAHIDLSSLQQVNTSKLQILGITYCSFDSLSPLSLCDLSSFYSLIIQLFPQRDRLCPLNGLSSDITRYLKELTVHKSNLEDLSPLSDCDLSSLQDIDISSNQSLPDIVPLSDCDLSSLERLELEDIVHLSDLSPFRGSDLSSLKYLNCVGTSISDLSPLCECKGLALEALDIYYSPIEDLSPLSLLDLSRLNSLINLSYTKVSDLFPLEDISYDGVVVDIMDTPAMEKMEEEGLQSPQTIGKVKVIW